MEVADWWLTLMANPSHETSRSVSLNDDLQREYQRRFQPLRDYRRQVWRILVNDFFQKYVSPDSVVLDIGCGWGEFINQVKAGRRLGMDLNPDSRQQLDSDVEFLMQDCSAAWPVPRDSLDVVFSSNFFEHLPNKLTLKLTLEEAFLALRPGGKLICVGPNIKFLPGTYWDFWDHEVALTELSLREILEIIGFEIVECHDRFLPYTMVGSAPKPLWTVGLYLKLPFVWKIFGKQFLLIVRKPEHT